MELEAQQAVQAVLGALPGALVARKGPAARIARSVEHELQTISARYADGDGSDKASARALQLQRSEAVLQLCFEVYWAELVSLDCPPDVGFLQRMWDASRALLAAWQHLQAAQFAEHAAAIADAQRLAATNQLLNRQVFELEQKTASLVQDVGALIRSSSKASSTAGKGTGGSGAAAAAAKGGSPGAGVAAGGGGTGPPSPQRRRGVRRSTAALRASQTSLEQQAPPPSPSAGSTPPAAGLQHESSGPDVVGSPTKQGVAPREAALDQGWPPGPAPPLATAAGMGVGRRSDWGSEADARRSSRQGSGGVTDDDRPSSSGSGNVRAVQRRAAGQHGTLGSDLLPGGRAGSGEGGGTVGAAGELSSMRSSAASTARRRGTIAGAQHARQQGVPSVLEAAEQHGLGASGGGGRGDTGGQQCTTPARACPSQNKEAHVQAASRWLRVLVANSPAKARQPQTRQLDLASANASAVPALGSSPQPAATRPPTSSHKPQHGAARGAAVGTSPEQVQSLVQAAGKADEELPVDLQPTGAAHTVRQSPRDGSGTPSPHGALAASDSVLMGSDLAAEDSTRSLGAVCALRPGSAPGSGAATPTALPAAADGAAAVAQAAGGDGAAGAAGVQARQAQGRSVASAGSDEVRLGSVVSAGVASSLSSWGAAAPGPAAGGARAAGISLAPAPPDSSISFALPASAPAVAPEAPQSARSRALSPIKEEYGSTVSGRPVPAASTLAGSSHLASGSVPGCRPYQQPAQPQVSGRASADAATAAAVASAAPRMAAPPPPPSVPGAGRGDAVPVAAAAAGAAAATGVARRVPQLRLPAAAHAAAAHALDAPLHVAAACAPATATVAAAAAAPCPLGGAGSAMVPHSPVSSRPQSSLASPVPPGSPVGPLTANQHQLQARAAVARQQGRERIRGGGGAGACCLSPRIVEHTISVSSWLSPSAAAGNYGVPTGASAAAGVSPGTLIARAAAPRSASQTPRSERGSAVGCAGGFLSARRAPAAPHQQARPPSRASSVGGSGVGALRASGGAPLAPQGVVSLAELRVIIQDVFNTKAAANCKALRERRPTATMAQHLDAYVLRKTAGVDTADRAMAAVIRAVTNHMGAHPDIAVFAKVLSNEVEEEYWLEHHRQRQRFSAIAAAALRAATPRGAAAPALASTSGNSAGTGGSGSGRGLGEPLLRTDVVALTASWCRGRSSDEARSAAAAVDHWAVAHCGAGPHTALSVQDALLSWELRQHESALESVVAHFRAVDRAGSGALTLPQFRRFCRRLNPGAMSEEEVAELFRELCPAPGRYGGGGGAGGPEQRVTFSTVAHSLMSAIRDAEEGGGGGGR